MRQWNWSQPSCALRRELGPIAVSQQSWIDFDRPLIAVTSSRLGYDHKLKRSVCRYLCQTMLDCRHRQAAVLVALGSAIEPWAIRAAELFAVPAVTLSVDANNAEADLLVSGANDTALSRDTVVILMADRVDAVYVRRRGLIERSLRTRIEQRNDASTRVAVLGTDKCAATDLIQNGAIGWYCPSRSAAGAITTKGAPSPTRPRQSIESDSRSEPEGAEDETWTTSEGQWLIHCTRAARGPWPGESERQYWDTTLLATSDHSDRGPLETLCRILSCGRISTGSVATRADNRVVCFSALSLRELLAKRCFRPHLHRWDYDPYGVAIRLASAKRIGIQPVIYGGPEEYAALAPKQRFRFHPVGKTYDWRQEREWRSSASIDLSRLDPEDVRVFAEDTPVTRQSLKSCRFRVTFVST